MNHLEDTVNDEDAAGMRIDRYVAEKLTLFSRSQGKSRITKVLLNGKEVKPGKKLSPGDHLDIFYTDPEIQELIPEEISLSIVFEDKNVIVINKPQGMVVHPGCGNQRGTMVNALLFHCKQLATEFEAMNPRPGIVHRLDKDTSGLIIVAKNSAAHEFLARQFRQMRIKKLYYTFTMGQPPEQKGVIDTKLIRDRLHRKLFKVSEHEGKRAITRYRLLKTSGHYSFLMLRPRTGRTHQLRVHMKHVKCSILGDPLYGKRDRLFPHATLMLHAYKLVIRLPATNTMQEFIAPLPSRFREIMDTLGM
jgi:23S rRNA pseudouridine1911/1915/1917 synthase